MGRRITRSMKSEPLSFPDGLPTRVSKRKKCSPGNSKEKSKRKKSPGARSTANSRKSGVSAKRTSSKKSDEVLSESSTASIDTPRSVLKSSEKNEGSTQRDWNQRHKKLVFSQEALVTKLGSRDLQEQLAIATADGNGTAVAVENEMQASDVKKVKKAVDSIASSCREDNFVSEMNENSSWTVRHASTKERDHVMLDNCASSQEDIYIVFDGSEGNIPLKNSGVLEKNVDGEAARRNDFVNPLKSLASESENLILIDEESNSSDCILILDESTSTRRNTSTPKSPLSLSCNSRSGSNSDVISANADGDVKLSEKNASDSIADRMEKGGKRKGGSKYLPCDEVNGFTTWLNKGGSKEVIVVENNDLLTEAEIVCPTLHDANRPEKLEGYSRMSQVSGDSVKVAEDSENQDEKNKDGLSPIDFTSKSCEAINGLSSLSKAGEEVYSPSQKSFMSVMIEKQKITASNVLKLSSRNVPIVVSLKNINNDKITSFPSEKDVSASKSGEKSSDSKNAVEELKDVSVDTSITSAELQDTDEAEKIVEASGKSPPLQCFSNSEDNKKFDGEDSLAKRNNERKELDTAFVLLEKASNLENIPSIILSEENEDGLSHAACIPDSSENTSSITLIDSKNNAPNRECNILEDDMRAEELSKKDGFEAYIQVAKVPKVIEKKKTSLLEVLLSRRVTEIVDIEDTNSDIVISNATHNDVVVIESFPGGRECISETKPSRENEDDDVVIIAESSSNDVNSSVIDDIPAVHLDENGNSVLFSRSSKLNSSPSGNRCFDVAHNVEVSTADVDCCATSPIENSDIFSPEELSCSSEISVDNTRKYLSEEEEDISKLTSTSSDHRRSVNVPNSSSKISRIEVKDPDSDVEENFSNSKERDVITRHDISDVGILKENLAKEKEDSSQSTTFSRSHYCISANVPVSSISDGKDPGSDTVEENSTDSDVVTGWETYDEGIPKRNLFEEKEDISKLTSNSSNYNRSADVPNSSPTTAVVKNSDSDVTEENSSNSMSRNVTKQRQASDEVIPKRKLSKEKEEIAEVTSRTDGCKKSENVPDSSSKISRADVEDLDSHISAETSSCSRNRSVTTWHQASHEDIAVTSKSSSVKGSRSCRDSQMFDMNSSYLHVLNRICEEVHQEMSGKIEKEKTIEWTVNMEVLFLYAMIGHKPVGVNKHFMMLLIHNKFSSFINHEISSKALWDKLDTLYDMSALHESEIIPFPNEEEEFELPEEFHDLLHSKHSIALKKSNTESETSKNSTNISKSSKKVTPKLKQGTPASAAKNTFASPALNKPQKSQTGVKSDSKASTSDGTPKLKESGSSAKASKIKRSSSPFTSKSTKSESATASKEGSPDVSLPKKSNKLERGSSPAIIKKPAKADSTMNSSSKKPAKSESSTNGSKPAKTETSENPTKRDKKVDKDTANKKSKNTPSAEVSGKKPKLDAVGAKKRSESESSRKSVESSSSVKQVKADVKHSNQSNKGQEAENSTLSGSRKSSPVVKVKNNESNKKLKRPRVEEPSKRSTPAPKRRRQ